MAEQAFEKKKGTLLELGNILSKGEYSYRSVTVFGEDNKGKERELVGEHWSKDKKTLEAYEELKGQEVEYSYTEESEKSSAKVRVYPVKTEKEKGDYKAKSGGGSSFNNPERFLWEKERAAKNDVRIEWQEIFNDIAPFYVEMYKNKSAQDTTKLIDCAPYIKLAVEKTTEVQAGFAKEA